LLLSNGELIAFAARRVLQDHPKHPEGCCAHCGGALRGDDLPIFDRLAHLQCATTMLCDIARQARAELAKLGIVT